MEQRYLGKTGLKVSELCLGAMTFGRPDEADENESHAMLDAFVAAGGNFIDTANVYSTGISEEILGRWLVEQRREDLVVATKVRFSMGDGLISLGSAANISLIPCKPVCAGCRPSTSICTRFTVGIPERLWNRRYLR